MIHGDGFFQYSALFQHPCLIREQIRILLVEGKALVDEFQNGFAISFLADIQTVAGQHSQMVVQLCTPNQILTGFYPLLQGTILLQGTLDILLFQLHQFCLDEVCCNILRRAAFLQEVQNFVNILENLVSDKDLHFNNIKAQVVSLHGYGTVDSIKSFPILSHTIQAQRHQQFRNPSTGGQLQQPSENFHRFAVISGSKEDLAHKRQHFCILRCDLQCLLEFFLSFRRAAQLRQAIALDLQHFRQSG